MSSSAGSPHSEYAQGALAPYERTRIREDGRTRIRENTGKTGEREYGKTGEREYMCVLATYHMKIPKLRSCTKIRRSTKELGI
jgi:hypothetical protein